jgi:hypothetical protein
VRRRRGRRREKGRRVEELLDQVRSGKSRRDARRARDGSPDDSRDHRADRPDRRQRRNWQGHRTLDFQRNRELFDRLVALDFDYLLGLNFAASPRVLADLLPQSVTGRAQNGHGWFTDEFGTSLIFPDATFERVLTVLEAGDPNLKAHLVRQRRGQMLERFADWLFANLDRPELELVVDGQPLFGVDFLGEARVDTRQFLQGLVLAGFMDDWGYRRTTMMQHKRTFLGFPFHMGGGEILIVDREAFEQCGLGDTGATVFLDDQMRTLHDIGVICRNRHVHYAFPEHDQAFFRRQLGDGVCDDLAMIYVGARYGFSAMLGAFVMDAIDTYDKYLLNLTWGGFDTALAGRIQKHFRDTEDEPLVCDSEILDLIHFAAKANDPPVRLSSSHRRLIQVEKHSAVPTLLNHWRFLRGDEVYQIDLGFARVPAKEFYGAAWKRLQVLGLEPAEPQFIKLRGA